MNKISGIIEKLEEAAIHSPTFYTRNLVLRIETPYSSEYCVLQAKNSRADALDMYAEGQSVEVGFHLSGYLIKNDAGKKEVRNQLSLVYIKKVTATAEAPKPAATAAPVVSNYKSDWDALEWQR